jgi:hypothetical protein
MDHDHEGLAIASYALTYVTLHTLVKKGVVPKEEIRSLIDNALRMIEQSQPVGEPIDEARRILEKTFKIFDQLD